MNAKLRRMRMESERNLASFGLLLETTHGVIERIRDLTATGFYGRTVEETAAQLLASRHAHRISRRRRGRRLMNNEIQSPDEQDFTPDARLPHAFVECHGPHLFPRGDRHCSICDGAEDAEIHKTAVAA